jgi:hypothetical protein
MAGLNQPDFIERQEAAAKARKFALEKFRADGRHRRSLAAENGVRIDKWQNW